MIESKHEARSTKHNRTGSRNKIMNHISEENRDILSEIYSEIDDKEDQPLLSNPRKLSERDHQDLYQTGYAEQTVYDLFAYANRPRREVLNYMLNTLPCALDKILTNTRNAQEA